MAWLGIARSPVRTHGVSRQALRAFLNQQHGGPSTHGVSRQALRAFLNQQHRWLRRDEVPSRNPATFTATAQGVSRQALRAFLNQQHRWLRRDEVPSRNPRTRRLTRSRHFERGSFADRRIFRASATSSASRSSSFSIFWVSRGGSWISFSAWMPAWSWR